MDGKNFYDYSIKNDIKTNSLKKITTGQGDDYIPGCLLDYNYFDKHYNMIAIDLSEKQYRKLISLEIYEVQIIE